MSRGLPSMTALLGLLALADYQNRDKLAELLKSAGGDPKTGAQQGPLADLLGSLRGGRCRWRSRQPIGRRTGPTAGCVQAERSRRGRGIMDQQGSQQGNSPSAVEAGDRRGRFSSP
jgi:uncharacterized protein YidB (DUF937 family)